MMMMILMMVMMMMLMLMMLMMLMPVMYEEIPDRGLAFTSEDFTTLDCNQKRSRQLFGGYCLM